MAASRDVIDTLIAEAGSSPEGLRAVAWVILNRSNQWGKTPSQIVRQRGQFEGYSNPGPKSVEAQQMPHVRELAEQVWAQVANGEVSDPTGGGTQFRAKGYTKGMPSPHGTVTIAGNTFALGGQRSSSALDAIEAMAPTPLPRPSTSLTAFAPITGASAPRPLPENAMFGVRFPPGQSVKTAPPMTPNRSYYAGGSSVTDPDGRLASLLRPQAGGAPTAAPTAPRSSPALEPVRASAVDPVGAGPGSYATFTGLLNDMNGTPARQAPTPLPRLASRAPIIKPLVQRDESWVQQGPDMAALGAIKAPPPAPSPGLTTRTVKTVPIDLATGNPIIAAAPPKVPPVTMADTLREQNMVRGIKDQSRLPTYDAGGPKQLPAVADNGTAFVTRDQLGSTSGPIAYSDPVPNSALGAIAPLPSVPIGSTMPILAAGVPGGAANVVPTAAVKALTPLPQAQTRPLPKVSLAAVQAAVQRPRREITYNFPRATPGDPNRRQINDIDMAFMPLSVQTSSRWNTGY